MNGLIQGWSEYTNEQKHKVLWDWLSENPGMEKVDFFEMNKIEDMPPSGCYACMECQVECSKCPIDWTKLDEAGSPCTYSDSLFYEWFINIGEFEKRAELATRIANMPWKTGGWNQIMDKTIAEIKDFMIRVKNRQQAITVEIRELKAEYESLSQTFSSLDDLEAVARNEQEESEDDIK